MSGDALLQMPLCLTVPGYNGSGPRHWQTLWEQSRPDCERVELGMWSTPHRNHWVTKLDQAVRRAHAPIILVGHSLGCHAIAWWAHLVGQPYGWPVVGALMVAPPYIDASSADRLRKFGAAPPIALPFPSILVASEDDPYASLRQSRRMAVDWQCHFVDIGCYGHINADSGIGQWVEGQLILERLIGVTSHSRHNPSVSPAASTSSGASPSANQAS